MKKKNQQGFNQVHQEKREKTQINKIRSERGEITTDTTEIERIVRNYYKQASAKKFENQDEMDKFLEIYNLPKLIEVEVESLKRPKTAEEIKAVIKKLLLNKSHGPDGFTGEFDKTFKEELIPILLRLSQEIQEDRRLSNSIYEASIILIPKTVRDTAKKENYRTISLMKIDAKILQQQRYTYLWYLFSSYKNNSPIGLGPHIYEFI